MRFIIGDCNLGLQRHYRQITRNCNEMLKANRQKTVALENNNKAEWEFGVQEELKNTSNWNCPEHLETFSPSYHHMKIRNFGRNLVQNTAKWEVLFTCLYSVKWLFKWAHYYNANAKRTKFFFRLIHFLNDSNCKGTELFLKCTTCEPPQM